MRPDLRGVRVLVVGDFPPPLGGVAVHVRSLWEAARKAGADATVLDVGKGQHRRDGVVASGGELLFAANLARLAAQHDVVHLHTSGANPKSWVLVAGVGLAAKAARAKAVVTFHSGHGPRYLSTPLRALTARLALAPYHRVVCVNDEIARTLSRLGAAEGRHVVAPAFGREGVEPGELPPAAAAYRAAHPQLVSAMLAPGRDYGARELFGAYARLRETMPDAGLAVYGPGTDSEQTRALAEELGATPLLRLGELERARGLAVIQASDVFVRPTLVDGDAVSVREALALGTPVVATRVGTRPAEARLVPPADSKALAQALKAVLSGPRRPRTKAEGQDGIEMVLEVYGRLAGVAPGLAA